MSASDPGCYLKRKVSQVWDWNADSSAFLWFEHDTWKEKYLKYEIETRLIIPMMCILQTWKEKYLKYEIETQLDNIRE